jgi:hypothetical protein
MQRLYRNAEGQTDAFQGCSTIGLTPTLASSLLRSVSTRLYQAGLENVIRMPTVTLVITEATRNGGFPIEGYDEMNVGEISGMLDGLSEEELRRVRDHEKRNKNRDTLIEQLDRKLRSNS